AMQVHICIAMGLTSATETPITPPAQLKERFAARFRTQDDFSSLVRNLGNRPAQQPHLQHIQAARTHFHNNAATGNSLGKDVARVEDLTLRILFSMMDQYGFETWCPDLSDSPSSLYNNAHRAFAVDSFQQACMMGGYLWFGVIPEQYQDTFLLAKIYDSYVFGTLKDKARKEARDPGALERRQEANGIRKRRQSLAANRELFLRTNGYLERVIKAVAGSYCASEDE
ncbi:hypothetical protein K435DRAFT_570039, partial [Dendrothele bispora CBS 962.96]